MGFTRLQQFPTSGDFSNISGRLLRVFCASPRVTPEDINQIFDILPIMGTLQPGHTQEPLEEIKTIESVSMLARNR